MGCVLQALSLLQEGDILVGAERLYIQPVRRQHWELVPPWAGAQPHLIHRHAPTVPGVLQGTAPGRGRAGAPQQEQLWERDKLSLQLGGCEKCPLRIEGVPSL